MHASDRADNAEQRSKPSLSSFHNYFPFCRSRVLLCVWVLYICEAGGGDMDVGVCWLVGWLVSVIRRIGLLVCLWSWVLLVGGSSGWCGWLGGHAGWRDGGCSQGRKRWPVMNDVFVENTRSLALAIDVRHFLPFSLTQLHGTVGEREGGGRGKGGWVIGKTPHSGVH